MHKTVWPALLAVWCCLASAPASAAKQPAASEVLGISSEGVTTHEPPAALATPVTPPSAPAIASSAPELDGTNLVGPSSALSATAGPAAQLPTPPLAIPDVVNTGQDATALPIRIVVALTAIALLPAMLICVTAFLRIIIVLSMLRHAIGMPETPPNVALIGLALFLTLFTMSPVLEQVNRTALQPYLVGKFETQKAFQAAITPIRDFMVRQTREQDMALMIELSKAPQPTTIDDVGNLQLIPAFMLSELRAAFQLGFLVFLPFLLIDLIVASVLMALGMMMMPPVTVALPLKLLLFVSVDGWSLLLRGLIGSFH